MSPLITAVILVKDEDKLINECIGSLSFCDEILIIDDNSTDDTIKIVDSLTSKKIKVISHNLDNNFSQARNFGLQKARNEWVLFVDSDELISDALAYEISSVVHTAGQDVVNLNGFYIKRQDIMWRKKLKYGETGSIKLLRLARKSAGEWVGMVHEEWRIKGKVGTLINPIIHYPHPTVAEFLKKINFYSTLKAEELYLKKIKTNMLSLIMYPSSKLIINFVLRKGFLDGIPGLIYALLMSFHSFLVRGKLWAKWDKHRS